MRQRDSLRSVFNLRSWGTEIGLSRLFLASYNKKARGHDETPARQQSHRHEIMRPKATDLQSQKVIVVVSRAEWVPPSWLLREHGLVVKSPDLKTLGRGFKPALGTLGKVSENLFLGSTQAM